MTKPIEMRVYKKTWDVSNRLSQLGLDNNKLDKVGNIAFSAAANVTEFHPMNAAGMFSYLEGTKALREEFVGKEWELDRADNVEAIFNEALKIKVIFTNVDVACSSKQTPKPRSQKGEDSKRACEGNSLFDNLPFYSKFPNADYMTYYFMLDHKGAYELSSPVVERRTFTTYHERIFIGSVNSQLDIMIDDRADNEHVNIEPVVWRK